MYNINYNVLVAAFKIDSSTFFSAYGLLGKVVTSNWTKVLRQNGQVIEPFLHISYS